MTSTRASAILILAFVVGTLACIQAPVEVQVFDTERADLTKIRSFALIPPPWPHPEAGADIESQIRDVFESKGLTEVEPGDADMLVSYRASGERRSRRRTTADISTQYTVEEEYIESTLEIDLFDPGSREVLWRGVAHVDVFSDPAIPAAARKAVRAILADWPRPGDGR
jgi:hypothetical protein